MTNKKLLKIIIKRLYELNHKKFDNLKINFVRYQLILIS